MFREYPREANVNPFRDFSVGDYTHVKSDQIKRARARIRHVFETHGYRFETRKVSPTVYEVRRVESTARTIYTDHTHEVLFAGLEVGDAVIVTGDEGLLSADRNAYKAARASGYDMRFRMIKLREGVFKFRREA